MDRKLSRRDVLAIASLLLAGTADAQPANRNRKLKVAIFSKHPQFLQEEELAKGATTIGFAAPSELPMAGRELYDKFGGDLSSFM